MNRLWNVEARGNIVAKAQVVAEAAEHAVKAVKEQVAEHIANFVHVSKVDVHARLNVLEWSAVPAPTGVVKLDWDIVRPLERPTSTTVAQAV